MGQLPQRYLVEDAERERESCRILLDLWPIVGSPLAVGLGVIKPWFILELQENRLRDCIQGEADIVLGPLEWAEPEKFKVFFEEEVKEGRGRHPSNIAFSAALRLANAGGIKWPPSTGWLVAVEAKCMYLDPKADSISPEHMKSTKASVQSIANVRKQLDRLLQLGFDRVALLDIVANPPVSGPDGGAWITAVDVADRSRQVAMSQFLKDRLPVDSPVGHYIWSVGAVSGGDERWRGAGAAVELRAPRDNPLLSDDRQVREHRQEMEQNLLRIFESLPKPLNLRVILFDCLTCGHIHPEGSPCTG